MVSPKGRYRATLAAKKFRCPKEIYIEIDTIVYVTRNMINKRT